MEYYMLVYDNGDNKMLGGPKFFIHHPTPLFYVRKKEGPHYGYGCHDDYYLINEEGNDATLKVGDNYELISYKTTGTAYCFQLVIRYKKDGVIKEHALYCDTRDWLGRILDYDDEWDRSNPANTVISFIKDLSTMGDDARIAIDSLKRQIWTMQKELFYKKQECETKTTICKGSVEIVLPDGLTKINGDQFESCYSVKSIIIPESVSEIICSAFNNLSCIESIILKGNRVIHLLPPVQGSGDRGYGITSTKATFYVPKEMVEVYKQNWSWKNLADRIMPIE